jgi:hypothetical protein
MLNNETLFLEYYRSIPLRSFMKYETFLNSKSKNLKLPEIHNFNSKI